MCLCICMRTCVCIRVCMCVCVPGFVYTCVSMFESVCENVRHSATHAYTCVYVFGLVCVRVLARVMCVSVHSRARLCMCMSCICMCTYVCVVHVVHLYIRSYYIFSVCMKVSVCVLCAHRLTTIRLHTRVLMYLWCFCCVVNV